MQDKNRYTKIVSRIRRNFEKVRTDSVTVPADGRALVSNTDSPEWVGENEPFANYAPWNMIHVRNEGDTAVTVHLDSDRAVSITVPAGGTRELTDNFYFGWISAENEGTSESTVDITYGRVVDSRELDILKMSGLLNVEN